MMTTEEPTLHTQYRTLFCELLADGTVPQQVRLSRRRPTLLDHEQVYFGSSIDNGLDYRAWALLEPVDDEGDQLETFYVVLSWTEDDGWACGVFADPLKAIGNAAEGWGSMNYRAQYLVDDDSGRNLVFWGGSGLDFEETEDGYSTDGDPSCYVHLYSRWVDPR